jgi:hypothetical protein
MAIWYIMWSFDIFPRFGMLYPEKSGNPGSDKSDGFFGNQYSGRKKRT